jgi:hypothetical protein
MRVYIGQYDYFWSLSYSEWTEICKQGANGDGYDLTRFKQLKSRPKGLLKDSDNSSYYATNNEILYFEPLDWYAEEFEDWLKDNGIN